MIPFNVRVNTFLEKLRALEIEHELGLCSDGKDGLAAVDLQVIDGAIYPKALCISFNHKTQKYDARDEDV